MHILLFIFVYKLIFCKIIFLFFRFGFAAEHSPRCIIHTCCTIDGVLIPDIYECKDVQKLTLALSNFINLLFYK